jgi:proteasome accessory factor C
MSPRPLAGPRLARVLALVPYVQAHPGTTLDELAERFVVPRREIERDLELLPFCGLPPYTADRLIDVWVDDDGTVDIMLAEYFDRPLRLTPAEGVALVAAARALLAVPGADPDGALATATAKLSDVVGATGRLHLDLDADATVAALRSAVEHHETVEVDYWSHSRDEVTTRRLDPDRVFNTGGAWYCAAWCHRAAGERLFRVDRMVAVRPTGSSFTPRDADYDPDTLVYHPRPDDPRVTLRLAPSVAWVAESLPVEARTDAPGGGVEVTLAVSGPAFLDRLLLRLGPDAEVVAPVDVAEQRRAAAARILARYT